MTTNNPGYRVLDERFGDYTDPLRGDPDAALRQRRLAELGFGDRPDPRLDAFAAALAHAAADLVHRSTPDAMFNLFTGGRQYFAGMYLTAQGGDTGDGLRHAHTPGREMSLDTGWCPHVVATQRARVLDDVCAWTQFASNPAVANLGIRSYLGAPLIDPETGITLGTVCVIARDTRPYGRRGLEFIKDHASAGTELLLTGHAPHP